MVLTHAFGAGGNLQFIRAQSFLFTGEHEAVTQSKLDDLLSSAFEINQGWSLVMLLDEAFHHLLKIKYFLT